MVADRTRNRQLEAQGWMRGADFYSPTELRKALRYGLRAYATRFFLQTPDLLNPRDFNEWVIRSNYLRYLKVPETGNRLFTANFIPEDLRSSLTCPRIIWNGRSLNWEQWPYATERPFYLKASHGSDMFLRIAGPVSPSQRARIERLAAGWLASSYGRSHGEWYYNAFTPELLMEEDIGGNGYSINCFSFRGEVAAIALFNKATREIITMREDMTVVGQRGSRTWNQLFSPSTLKKAVSMASQISHKHDFVRVDFLADNDERIYLGEMTFAPGNGLSRRPQGINEYLGQKWTATC